MIAGDLDVSYIVINQCNVFGMTCVSVKPAKLLVTGYYYYCYYCYYFYYFYFYYQR